MALASGIIVPWPSTAASIPANFTRKTAWDGLYFRAKSSGTAGTTGGNATHTHSNDAGHFHVSSGSHSHSILGGTGAPLGNLTGTGTVSSKGTHTHNAVSATASPGNSGSTATNIDAETNELDYVEVIWIESNGSPAGIPNGALGMFASDSLPSSWTRVHGDKYLKGAATSGDGGGTGGANTHSHTDGGHNHTIPSHSHAAVTSSAPSEPIHTDQHSNKPGLTVAALGHTHQVGINGTGLEVNTGSVTMDAASSEPAWEKLNCISNGTGGDDLPDQIIEFWGGSTGTIPTDWALYDAGDDFVKNCNANSEVGTTGGTASGHTHTNVSCTITGAHDHNDSTNTSAPSATNPIRTTGTDWASGSHGHNGQWNVQDANITYAAASITIGTSASEAHYPPWVEAILIQYTEPVAGGTNPTLMMMGVGA